MKTEIDYEKLEAEFQHRNTEISSFLADEEIDEDLLFPSLESLKSINEERYSNVRFVAEGGEKKIEAVFDATVQRDIALATPKKNDRQNAERFVKEGRVTGFLEHPNIMPVYDIGLKGETPYFTMKLVSGKTLADYRPGGVLECKTLDDLLSIFVKVCDAVQFAHSKGVSHLDIKPSNIQIGEFGEVLLSDWGLASVKTSETEGSVPESIDDSLAGDLTLYGKLKGTPGFMSPAMAGGKNGGPSDDLFSLGATLYFILCGEPPFKEKTIEETLEKTRAGRCQKPSERHPEMNIPAGLEAVAMKALSITDSYTGVSELRNEIVDYLRGYATKAEEAGAMTILKLLYQRQKVLINTILAAVVVLVIVTGLFIKSIQEEKAKEIQARHEAESARLRAEYASEMYLNELRFNRYLMEGMDASLKKIIQEVEDKNLPVDIEKILVKVGRGNINARAYEAAAQMLETLAATSTGQARDDAIHDLIFTRIFMHRFAEALELLNGLDEKELERADIFQFIPICERYKDRLSQNGLLNTDDLFSLVKDVKKHQRVRIWFFTHLYNYYLRKCNSDKEVLELLKVILNADRESMVTGAEISNNYGLKTLFFTDAENLRRFQHPKIIDAMKIEYLDLRGTSIQDIFFTGLLSIREINLSNLEIEDFRPLNNIKTLEKVYLSREPSGQVFKKLKKRGVEIIVKP